MKIMYDVGDQVIIKSIFGMSKFNKGDTVVITSVDSSAFAHGDEPYQIGDGENTEWVYDHNIKPATVPFLTEMNEEEVTEYKDKMLKADTQAGLDFLANHPDGYFLPKEIIDEANLKFITPNTLEKMIEDEGRYPVENHYGYSWQQGWSIQSRKEELTKTYVGDSNGKVIKRTKTIHYYNMIKRGEN